MEPGVFSTLHLWSFLRSLDLRARDAYFRLPKAVKQVSVKEAIGDLPKLRSGRAAQFAYICVSDLHHWRQAASP